MNNWKSSTDNMQSWFVRTFLQSNKALSFGTINPWPINAIEFAELNFPSCYIRFAMTSRWKQSNKSHDVEGL